MANFKANRNLMIGRDGQKPLAVKKGEVFECTKEYHAEHLDEQGHAEETDEPVTVIAKAAAKKQSKAEKG